MVLFSRLSLGRCCCFPHRNKFLLANSCHTLPSREYWHPTTHTAVDYCGDAGNTTWSAGLVTKLECYMQKTLQNKRGNTGSRYTEPAKHQRSRRSWSSTPATGARGWSSTGMTMGERPHRPPPAHATLTLSTRTPKHAKDVLRRTTPHPAVLVMTTGYIYVKIFCVARTQVTGSTLGATTRARYLHFSTSAGAIRLRRSCLRKASSRYRSFSPSRARPRRSRAAVPRSFFIPSAPPPTDTNLLEGFRGVDRGGGGGGRTLMFCVR